MTALADEEIIVRRRVIVSLGKVGGRAVADPLTRILRRDSDIQARVLAARALADFPRARPALEEASRDPNSRLRCAALTSLKRLDKGR